MDVGKHTPPTSHLQSVASCFRPNEATADGVAGQCPAHGDVEASGVVQSE